MSRHEFISVLMPVHNAERYVGAAIESLLQQTLTDFEVIAVDDGSTDRSAEIIQAYSRADGRIRYVGQQHAGLVASLNASIALSKGEYLARMDADDIACPRRLEHQAAFLAARGQYLAVGSQLECIDRDGQPIGVLKYEESHEAIEERLLFKKMGTTMPHPAVMMRRDAVIAVGAYRTKFVASEDRDLWLRLAERGRLANLPDVLLQYRLHLESFSHTRGAEQRRMAAVAVQDAYDRRGIPLPRDFVVPKWHSESAFDCRCGWVAWATREGNFQTARRHLGDALRERPLNTRCWRMAGRLALSVLAKGATLSLSRAWQRL